MASEILLIRNLNMSFNLNFMIHVYCIHFDISKTYVYYLFNLSCAQLVGYEKVT